MLPILIAVAFAAPGYTAPAKTSSAPAKSSVGGHHSGNAVHESSAKPSTGSKHSKNKVNKNRKNKSGKEKAGIEVASKTQIPDECKGSSANGTPTVCITTKSPCSTPAPTYSAVQSLAENTAPEPSPGNTTNVIPLDDTAPAPSSDATTAPSPDNAAPSKSRIDEPTPDDTGIVASPNDNAEPLSGGYKAPTPLYPPSMDAIPDDSSIFSSAKGVGMSAIVIIVGFMFL